MIITIVCDVLGQENNGTTVAAMNLIRFLKSRGDTVRILCCDQNKKGQKGYFIVPCINLGFALNKIVEKNNVTLAKPDKNICESAILGSDICHILIPFALGRAAIKICKKHNIPLTSSFHCQAENFTSHIFCLMSSRLANRIVYMNFYKHVYSKVDAIHYPTEFIKNYFEKEIKRQTPAYVISNGVNEIYKKIEVEKPLDGKFRIIFTGRFSKEKSHKILVKAVKKSKYKESIQLLFAGQGPKKEQIISLCKKLKINEPIINFYSREELVNVINSCDLYVHPAEIEIEAIACLEAIKCGLVPVIADSYRSATKNFAIDSRSLFKVNDYKDLASKIDYWIEHPKEKDELAKQYLASIKDMSQKNSMILMGKMIDETYKKHHEK